MRIVAMALLLVVALAPGVGAQPAADLDADGVADATDACPDTPPADLVGADGCSLCPCDGPAGEARPWLARWEHFRCVVVAARAMRAEGSSRRAYRDALRHARLSSCGDVTKTRCCLVRDLDDASGRCRIMAPERCDATLMHADTAADIGGGSCLPNPCTLP